jgi:cation diffusion facilitator CzcD-associated flavoprotein CzcO
MFTLGYPFRPWTDPRAIADGGSILRYLRQTAEEFGIDARIRYRQKVVGARWDSVTASWTVTASAGVGTTGDYTCGFLYVCGGYYSYDGGHRPIFPGEETFEGRIVHPQDWPSDLDYDGKLVVVIGSGATAVTLVPALARTASHVTMLQRSPSFVASLPAVDPVSAALGRLLPGGAAARLSRWKSIAVTTAFYQFCRRRPRAARKLLLSGVAAALPGDYPVDPHFNPAYDPWDQRMCVVPDGDLFEAMSAGRATVVTGEVETFTSTGVRLTSGEEVPADVVVSATGLRLLFCGGASLIVDGSEIGPGQTFMYKGCMLSDVPNFAVCFGYTNASWTLRADLTSRYVCRLLSYMKKMGYGRAVPRHREREVAASPLLDLTSGYVQRSIDAFPKQGSKSPWRLRQNYLLDFLDFKLGGVTTSMEFASSPSVCRPRARG